jgi:hypothetical protein
MRNSPKMMSSASNGTKQQKKREIQEIGETEDPQDKSHLLTEV